MTIPWVYGMPGVRGLRTATHRLVFRGGMPIFDYFPQGKVIDGVYSRDPGNTGDTSTLRAGLLMGKRTSGSAYAPSIIDVVSGALAAGATSITISAAGATELVRRVGTTGTFKLTGPPTANGVVQTETVTYSGASTTSGILTVTAIVNDYVTGSFVRPTDGSETPVAFISDGYGTKVTDIDGGNVSVPYEDLPIGGVVDSVQLLPVWPSDTSLQAWIIARLNDAAGGQFTFVTHY